MMPPFSDSIPQFSGLVIRKIFFGVSPEGAAHKTALLCLFLHIEGDYDKINQIKQSKVKKGCDNVKKQFVLVLVLLLLLATAACKKDAPGGEIQIGRTYDLSGVTQIKLENGHNGYSTYITNEADIADILSFVGDTVGKPLGSGRGYYEGSYSVVFSFDNGEEFRLTYGDDAVFYLGEGDDGYPIRYRLLHISISEDVIPFFSRFDQSGMVWEEK